MGSVKIDSWYLPAEEILFCSAAEGYNDTIDPEKPWLCAFIHVFHRFNPLVKLPTPSRVDGFGDCIAAYWDEHVAKKSDLPPSELKLRRQEAVGAALLVSTYQFAVSEGPHRDLYTAAHGITFEDRNFTSLRYEAYKTANVTKKRREVYELLSIIVMTIHTAVGSKFCPDISSFPSFNLVPYANLSSDPPRAKSIPASTLASAVRGVGRKMASGKLSFHELGQPSAMQSTDTMSEAYLRSLLAPDQHDLAVMAYLGLKLRYLRALEENVSFALETPGDKII